jgi:hypothetical protein
LPIVDAMGRLDGIELRIAEDREALDDVELDPLAREDIQQLELEQGGVEEPCKAGYPVHWCQAWGSGHGCQDNYAPSGCWNFFKSR